MKRNKPASVAAYIAGFPKETQKLLQQLRGTICEVAPGVEEVISYDIPGYKIKGKPLIYFAGFKNHVSVYPAPRGNGAFAKELAQYKGGKGTVQFGLKEPLPLDLVRRIVAFRMKENEQKEAAKKAVRKTEKLSNPSN